MPFDGESLEVALEGALEGERGERTANRGELDSPGGDAPDLSRRPPGGSWWLDAERRLRLFWRLLLFFFAFCLVQIATALVVLPAAAVIGRIVDSAAPPSAARFASWLDDSHLVLLVLLVLSALVATPLLLLQTLLFRRYVDRRPIRSLGWTAARSRSTGVPAGLALGGLSIGVSVGIVVAAGGYRPTWSGGVWPAVALIGPLILAAFQEEFLLRGYLLRNFVDQGRVKLGLFVSALVFWILHGLNPSAWSTPWVGVNLFLAGLLLGLAYLLSENLWFPTSLHFAWNFTQGPLLGVPVSGIDMPGCWRMELNDAAPAWLTGREFGLEGSAVCAAVQSIIIALMAQHYYRPSSHAVRTVACWSFWASFVVAVALAGGSAISADERPDQRPDGAQQSDADRPISSASSSGSASTARRVAVDVESRTAGAVVAPSAPLAHTAQLFPVDSAGRLVGPGRLDEQSDRLWENLSIALEEAGCGWKDLVKLNLYLADSTHAETVRRRLAARLTPGAEPAVSYVVTRLQPPGALVALDAVAVAPAAAPPAAGVSLRRSTKLAGGPRATHVGLLPPGGRIYVAGQAEPGDLRTATRKTLESLRRTLQHLGRSDADIVQLKSFIKPMADVAEAEAEFAAFFGERPVPPLVFVEWESSLPIEIELVARGPELGADSAKFPIEYVTPPGMTTSPVYSRVAVAYAPETIYIAGLYSRGPEGGAEQTKDVFAQLQELCRATGSDLRHLAKATYYVVDDDASRKLNELRPDYYDPRRPPAASKALVGGTGRADRTLTLDMIAVPAAR